MNTLYSPIVIQARNTKIKSDFKDVLLDLVEIISLIKSE